eukprot:4984480-Alexandrium_andersonii.AAC.1
MSASLVGSEMCIRDRRGPCFISTLPAGGRTRPLPRRREELDLRLRLVAVSYTHLTLPTICSV